MSGYGKILKEQTTCVGNDDGGRSAQHAEKERKGICNSDKKGDNREKE